MVGLQGSGKTTTSGKLALRLRERLRRRVLLASLDTQRPAAQLQLAQLAEQAQVPSLPIVAGQTPVQIAQPRHGHRRGARASTSSSSTPPAACRSTRR